MLDEKVLVSQQKLDVLDELLKPEVQESLSKLIEQLPKLLEAVTMLTKTYDFVKTMATDEIVREDTVMTVTEMATPIIAKAKLFTQNLLEAKERAENSDEVISLFGLLKMLKEPQVQSMLRFIDSFMQVSAEKSKRMNEGEEDGR